MADNPKKNAEGYNDPTPYEAEKHIRAQIRGQRARAQQVKEADRQAAAPADNPATGPEQMTLLGTGA